MIPPGYVTAPRLDTRGQRYQGDIVVEAPLLVPLADGRLSHVAGPAVLLTPTCDFAFKSGGEMRMLYAIEVFRPESALRLQFGQNVVPQHAAPFAAIGVVLAAWRGSTLAACFADSRRPI